MALHAFENNMDTIIDCKYTCEMYVKWTDVCINNNILSYQERIKEIHFEMKKS